MLLVNYITNQILEIFYTLPKTDLAFVVRALLFNEISINTNMPN